MIPYDSFKCRCCGENKFSRLLFYELCNVHCFLEMIHGVGMVDMELESGCRCWGKHVSIYEKLGIPNIPKNSLHLISLPDGTETECKAADISFKCSGEVIKPLRIGYLLQSHLIPLGATKIRGIGAMRTSVHLDLRDSELPVAWVRQGKAYVYDVEFKLLMQHHRKGL